MRNQIPSWVQDFFSKIQSNKEDFATIDWKGVFNRNKARRFVSYSRYLDRMELIEKLDILS